MNFLELPLHFLRPWWWLALLALPFVLRALARGSGGRVALARLADAALLPHLIHDVGTRQRLALALAGLAWVLAVAALSGPAWQKLPQPLYVNGAARVVVLSLSDDMLAQDLKPDRMTRARFAVRDLIDDAGDARTALVAYAGAAFTVAPLTDDRRTVLNLLRVLQPNVMPVPGNDAAAGLRRGVELLRQSQVQGGQIVLVSDTAGQGAVAAARAAHADGIRVDVLGIGTTAGAPVPSAGGGFASGAGGLVLVRRDDAALRAVASAGGGQYSVLRSDGGGIGALAAPAATRGGDSRDQRAALWRDGGIWLLPVLVVLGALAFRRGWLAVLALCVLPIGIPTAQAGVLDSLFQNRDQRAVQALRDHDPARAQRLATTPDIRGAADYRAGDFGAAAKSFAGGSDARARYNLGNSLAQQGEYGRAIDAWREALRRDPKFADARANIDTVEDWLRRHPQQGRSGNQGHPPSGQGSQGASGAQGGGQPQGGGAQNSQGSSGQGSSDKDGSSQAQGSGAGDGTRASQSDQGRAGQAGNDQGGPSAAEAAQNAKGTARARQGLREELGAANGANQQPGSGDAFALGQRSPDELPGLDGAQRALLHAVPDDPGALLRRKFRLEWEQRQQRERGEP